MQSLPFECARNWSGPTKHGQFWLTRPATVNTNCPYCGTSVAFSAGTAVLKSDAETVIWKTNCPSCDGSVRFFVICKNIEEESNDPCDGLCMYPSRIDAKKFFDTSELPDRTRTVYVEATRAFDAKLWRSTCSNCRTVLEGIVKQIWPESTPVPNSLSQKIRKLAELHAIPEPLVDLANLLREGGNLAAHLDDAKEPSQSVASAMLDLTTYFLEYVHVLPTKITQLRDRMEKL